MAITYSEEDCAVFVPEIEAVNGDSLLQIFRLSQDPVQHFAEVDKLAGYLWRRDYEHSTFDNVLDMGCGTGQWLHLAQLHYFIRGRSVGINLFETQTNKEHIDFVHGDINTMTEEDLQKHFGRKILFDRIWCNYTLGHCELSSVFNLATKLMRRCTELIMWDVCPANAKVKDFYGYNLNTPSVIAHTADLYGLRAKWIIPSLCVDDNIHAYVADNFAGVAPNEVVQQAVRELRPVLYTFKLVY